MLVNLKGQWVPIAVETWLKESFLYNVIYENILYCLFVFLGPLLILVSLNACLVSELLRARRRLRERRLPAAMCGDASVEGSEQNLTLVMIVIIVVFVVCQTPAFVNQLLFSIIGADDYRCGKVGAIRQKTMLNPSTPTVAIWVQL